MHYFAGSTIAEQGGVPEESTASIMALAGTGRNGSDVSLNAQEKGDGWQGGGFDTEYWDRNITIDVEPENEHMEYTKSHPRWPQ